MRSLLPERGFTAREIVLADVWLGLGGQDDDARADLEARIERYFETLPGKDVVRPLQASVRGDEPPRVRAGEPRRQTLPEWQEALNASPELYARFLDLRRGLELEAMGVDEDEKAALDQIRDGQMTGTSASRRRSRPSAGGGGDRPGFQASTRVPDGG